MRNFFFFTDTKVHQRRHTVGTDSFLDPGSTRRNGTLKTLVLIIILTGGGFYLIWKFSRSLHICVLIILKDDFTSQCWTWIRCGSLQSFSFVRLILARLFIQPAMQAVTCWHFSIGTEQWGPAWCWLLMVHSPVVLNELWNVWYVARPGSLVLFAGVGAFSHIAVDQDRTFRTNLVTNDLVHESSDLYFDTWMIFAFIDIYIYIYRYMCMYYVIFDVCQNREKDYVLQDENISWINTLWLKKAEKTRRGTSLQKKDCK